MELRQLLPYAPYGIQFKCTDTVSGEFEILPLVKIHLDHESVEIGAIEYDISYLGSDEVKILLHWIVTGKLELYSIWCVW